MLVDENFFVDCNFLYEYWWEFVEVVEVWVCFDVCFLVFVCLILLDNVWSFFLSFIVLCLLRVIVVLVIL